MQSRIYLSLLYKSHFLGIPYEWLLISLFFTFFVYPFTLLGAIAVFLVLTFSGRLIAIYYDNEFAKIILLKIRLQSVRNNKWWHYDKNKKSQLKSIINCFTSALFLSIQLNRFKRISSIIIKFINFIKKKKVNFFDIYNITNLEYITISHIKDNYLYHKDNSISLVVELEGIDFSTINKDQETFQNTKTSIINSLPLNIIFSYYIRREEKKISINSENISNITANEVNKKWINSFTVEYNNKYYILLTAKKVKILNLSVSDLKDKLMNTYSNIITSFNEFNPRLIESTEELSKIICELLNGFPAEIKGKKIIDIDPMINNPFQIGNFIIDSKEEFSTFLNIKEFQSKNLNESFFYQLNNTDFKHQFYLHFETKPSQLIKEELVKKIKRNKSIGGESAIDIIEESEEIIQSIESREITVGKINIAFQIFGKTKEELKKNITTIFNMMAINSLFGINEAGIYLAYYYSIMPSGISLHPREIQVTTKNIASMIFPTKYQSGYKTNSFGNSPVTTFYTTGESIYNFNFHRTADKGDNPSGHTLVIGSTGTGKTTLINFLLSQAHKYSELSFLCLDQLEGQKIFTEMHFGNYHTFENNNMLGVNPFKLETTTENQSFIKLFLKIMLDLNSEEERSIENALEHLIGSNKINLQEISNLATKKNTTLKHKLELWLKGTYKGHFNGDKTIKFAKLNCFNMTSIMQDQKLLSLYALYFFHNYIIQTKGKGGIIFFDELKTYLDTELGKLFITLTEQARKLNKIIIGGTQNLNQLNNENGIKIIENIETFIIFPKGGRLHEDEKKLYTGYIKLNDNEIDFLENNNPNCRMALIKKSNYSVIVFVDLSFLGDKIEIFNSNQETVQIFNQKLEILHQSKNKKYRN